MTPSELLVLARRQPVVDVERTIAVPGPELQALLDSGKPLFVAELLAHPDQHAERHPYRYGHVFGEPAPDEAISHLLASTESRDVEPEVADVAWSLVKVDDDGNVLASVNGLHESVLETDPTGREMRPRETAAQRW